MNQTQYSRIHIALSPWDLTDDYNRHAGVTMLSALEHSSQPVTIHLLYDAKLSFGKEKEEAYNKACYQNIADKYNCELEYHHVELPKWIEELPCLKKWTPGAMLRLYLPELLQDLDKIIYFDCDMIIRTSIDVLWNTNINKYLSACKDNSIPYFSRNRRKLYHKLGIDVDSYFCSGVLVMNLKRIRNEHPKFAENLLTYIKNNQNLPYPDQDLLNWFCEGNYDELDQKYNIYSDRNDWRIYSSDCIIHYADNAKPWIRYVGDIDNYYWNYLLRTPWCDEKSEILKYSRDVINLTFTRQNLHKYSCIGISGNKTEIILKEIGFIIQYSKSFIKKILQGIIYTIS
ncbi:MAG: glycosyltransferase family 8 protein [Methanocorpusculum sp.]|nr:glycosyltransferase family 8 protein [Methanocorpusculum sp.]